MEADLEEGRKIGREKKKYQRKAVLRGNGAHTHKVKGKQSSRSWLIWIIIFLIFLFFFFFFFFFY